MAEVRPSLTQVAAEAGLPRLELLNPVLEPEWDGLLLTHPGYSFAYGAAWAKVLCETYGYQPVYFTCRERNRLLGLLPVMEIDSWLTGHRGVALPFTDECQPLGSAGVDPTRLLQEAIRHGRTRGWKYFECKGGADLLPKVPASLCYYRHTLDLTPGEQELFSRLSPAVRRAVRKARHSGVEVKVAHSQEAMRIFYRLHCRTRQHHGLPPQPLSFFLNIHQHVISKDMGFVMLARQAGRPIAASVYFVLGKKAIYRFGASDDACLGLRGNNAVMWEAIRRLRERGVESLCLGRTSLGNNGLRRFKSGWGGTEQKFGYLKHSQARGGFVRGKDRSLGWYNGAVSWVPHLILRLVGASLYRHIG